MCLVVSLFLLGLILVRNEPLSVFDSLRIRAFFAIVVVVLVIVVIIVVLVVVNEVVLFIFLVLIVVFFVYLLIGSFVFCGLNFTLFGTDAL